MDVERMKKQKDPKGVACGYCGSVAGAVCTVTLAPEVGPLSIDWAHGTRVEAVNSRG